MKTLVVIGDSEEPKTKYAIYVTMLRNYLNVSRKKRREAKKAIDHAIEELKAYELVEEDGNGKIRLTRNGEALYIAFERTGIAAYLRRITHINNYSKD